MATSCIGECPLVGWLINKFFTSRKVRQNILIFVNSCYILGEVIVSRYVAESPLAKEN